MNRIKKCVTTLFGILALTTALPSYAMDETYARYKALLANMAEDEKVTEFIEENNYLSDRLLIQWLNYLAEHARWQTYVNYYQTTNNVTRQCYYLEALYKTGQTEEALSKVKPLWLVGQKQPRECIYIFNKWQQSVYYSDDLLWQRITLSMQNREYGFAKLLGNDLPANEQLLMSTWLKLIKNPQKLPNTKLQNLPHTPDVIVDVLKRLIYTNMNSAIEYWHDNEQAYDFTEAQKQAIYQKIALYMAIRNNPNAEKYFAKLNPETTPDLYHEWRLRAALKEQRWQDVNNIIKFLPAQLQHSPCWQYWYARSFEKIGQADKAQIIYAALSNKRNYYGFLASQRGGYAMSMEFQDYPLKPELLEPYQEQIDYINRLYKSKQYDKASLLSYELSNSLSKAAQYQLARRYASWHWYDKALMLANASEHKDDIHLRFPLAHRKLIAKYSVKYNISEAFVYAIIRQESTFRKGVKSSAGALGLMQVIPSTARKVSKTYQITLDSMDEMYQANTNINIGIAYLNLLSKQFDGHPILMAAAYNAGPKQVSRWVKNDYSEEVDLWIETLPWSETRNYLKNVISFHAVYQHRLDDEPSLESFMKNI